MRGFFITFVLPQTKCKIMENEVPKAFDAELINRHLATLPDASTCEVDQIERSIFEGFDRNSEVRPTYVTVCYLVFTKNETNDGWVFSGYHY